MSHDDRDRQNTGPHDSDRDVPVMMPDIGDQIFPEKLVSGWCISDGGRAEAGLPLFTASTDKIECEVMSPATGVLEIIVSANTAVRAGEVIAIIHQPRSRPAS